MITENKAVYYNIIKTGEVFDLSNTGDTVFHFIYFDSRVEIEKVIYAGFQKINYYNSIPVDWYSRHTFIAIPPCMQIYSAFRSYDDLLFRQFNYFPPGHFKYWKDGYLAGELYKTIINGVEYFYCKEWLWNSKYRIEVRRNHKSNTPSIIEKDGRVFTDEGIYLFTPDLNKNH